MKLKIKLLKKKMFNTISATKLLEKSAREREGNKSAIPDWLARIGGATLVLGGIGLLWYRNTSLCALRNLKLEQCSQLYLKMEKKAFLETYLETRTVYHQILTEFKLQNPAIAFNITEETHMERFVDALVSPYKENVIPILISAIRNSKHSKLSLSHFYKKKEMVKDQIRLKNRDGVELTQLEKKFLNVYNAKRFLSLGCLVKAFQGFQGGDQGDGLDHKECLQLLIDYEADIIRDYFQLYRRILIDNGIGDLERRKKEVKRIFRERLRMESLEAYTVEKHGARYAELPEEEKYHPLLIFLSKALTPPQGASYNGVDVSIFFLNTLFESQALVQFFLTNARTPMPTQNLVNLVVNILKDPANLRFVEEAEIKFDPKFD